MAFWGPVVAAGIGAASSLIGGKSQNSAAAAQAAQQNAFQEAQNQKQMDFQERMRKTQYQTSIGDLKAAGLNPMLAYTQGGAGTPSGATSAGASAPVENVMHSVGQSAKEGWQAYQNWKNSQAQEKLIGAQTHASEAEASYKNVLSLSTLLEQDNIPIKGKQMLSQIALNGEVAKLNSAQTGYFKEKAKNEYHGIPYGAFGSGQAARTGINLGNTAWEIAEDAKGKENPITKFINKHKDRRNGYNK
jgi:hypothetical protein